MQSKTTLETEALSVVFNSSSGKFHLWPEHGKARLSLERPDTDSVVVSTSRTDCPWPGHTQSAAPFGEPWLIAGMLLDWTPDALRHLGKSQPEVTVVSGA